MLCCLQTGVVRRKRGERGLRRYLVDDWSDDTLPVNCFLVELDGERLLFDTGQAAAAGRPGYLPRWHPFLRLARFELRSEDEAAAQLRSSGIDPSEVDTVVLSHLHTDHAGGLEQLAHARVIVTRTEWRRAVGIAGRLRGYLPQHWPAGLEVDPVDLDGPPVGPFPASLALDGDERLLLVSAPGHTPGHAALLVRDGERRYLLAGDLVHTAVELGETAPAVAAWARSEAVTVLAAHDRDAARLIRDHRPGVGSGRAPYPENDPPPEGTLL